MHFCTQSKSYLIVLLIFLSACSALFSGKQSYIVYPIKSGDTLYVIAQRFDVTVDEIQSINNISNPRNLQVGTQLKIPYQGQDLRRQPDDHQVAKSIFSGGSQAGLASDWGNKISLGSASRYVGALQMPVTASGTYVSSRFGKRWFNFHEGLDIAGPQGTPIYAAHSGQVIYSSSGFGGYGNMIVLKSDNFMTVYAHNRSNLVKKGEWVEKGTNIATLGNTGNATGAHLHFETRIRNSQGKYVAVDPIVFFK